MDEKVKKLLVKNHQEHILKMLDLCTEEQRKSLLSEIEKIDFNQLADLYKISQELNAGITQENKDSKLEPIKAVDKYNIDRESSRKLTQQGEDVIRAGKYAVVTMAGGQGTRLGHLGPKGTFLLNVEPKPKYLFEIMIDSLKRMNQKYKTVLNWYVMTSSENNDQTIKFLEEHDFFGYPKEYVKFFIQDNLPLLNEEGKLLLDKDFHIKFASSGNGNIYKAMKYSGILADMKQKGIEWVFIGAVDNVLLNMVDPMLVGLAIRDKSEIASKSIIKANPQERVGVFCKKNGIPAVIEYTELSSEMAEMENENKELVYGESHIMCNLYSLDALEKISVQTLPYHSAHKKIEYLDENGKIVKPEAPNAYKYEAFIFDGFNYFNNISILRGRRNEDFAPIKNKEGVDSPETARKLYNDFHNEIER